MDTSQLPADIPAEGTTRDRLRELRERAQASLVKQRERMRDMESRFSIRLEAVAVEIATELASESSAASAAIADAEKELGQQRSEWEAELARTDTELNQRMDELNSRLTDLAEREQQFESRQAEVSDREEVCRLQQDALAGERESLATAREALERDAALAGHAHDEQLAALEQQLAQHEARAAEQESQRIASAAEQEQLREQLDLALAQAASMSEALEAHDETLQETEQRRATDVAELRQELAEALATIESLEAEATVLREAADGGEHAATAWQQERELLQGECTQLAATLEKVTQKLAAAEASSEPIAELAHKFELAMADVRTLRQANAELEQELSRRPEHNDGESAELIALREERDALAAELEEMRSRPITTSGRDNQALADLQRRFEMAVDDIRELRAERERLEEQLAKRPQAAGTGPSGGGEQKWEELKRKLLLSLEEESGELPEERREERASIEHTIRITDDVVASKDREIHELRHQLETAEVHASNAHANHSMQEAINSDDVVQEQRARLAAMEEELTDKLRKAEMEMSIERARIAREQTELAEWRIELESLRDSIPNKPSSGPSSSGKGRWFSKLGLGGDEYK